MILSESESPGQAFNGLLCGILGFALIGFRAAPASPCRITSEVGRRRVAYQQADRVKGVVR